MTSSEEQQFLNELEKKLWTSANKLLPSLDASQYKHVALGLVFLRNSVRTQLLLILQTIALCTGFSLPGFSIAI